MRSKSKRLGLSRMIQPTPVPSNRRLPFAKQGEGFVASALLTAHGPVHDRSDTIEIGICPQYAETTQVERLPSKCLRRREGAAFFLSL